MVTDTNYTYSGPHFTIYTNIELLCYVPETNVVCQLYLSKFLKRGLKETHVIDQSFHFGVHFKIKNTITYMMNFELFGTMN